MERVNTLMLQTTALYIQYVLLQAIFGAQICYCDLFALLFSYFTITIHPVCFYESACLCQSHESQKPALRNLLFYLSFCQILNKSKRVFFFTFRARMSRREKRSSDCIFHWEKVCASSRGRKCEEKKRRQDHGRVREEWRKIGTVRAMGTKCLCVSCLNTTFSTLHIQRRNICL